MVRVALDAGHRHVDAAQAYGNEAGVGTAIVESGLPREDVFITTESDPQHHGHVSTEVFDSRMGADDMERIAMLEGDPNGAPSRTMNAGLPRRQS